MEKNQSIFGSNPCPHCSVTVFLDWRIGNLRNPIKRNYNCSLQNEFKFTVNSATTAVLLCATTTGTLFYTFHSSVEEIRTSRKNPKAFFWAFSRRPQDVPNDKHWVSLQRTR